MSKETEHHEKSDKTAPEKSLKEKRAAKAAKRDEKSHETVQEVNPFHKGK